MHNHDDTTREQIARHARAAEHHLNAANMLRWLAMNALRDPAARDEAHRQADEHLRRMKVML